MKVPAHSHLRVATVLLPLAVFLLGCYALKAPKDVTDNREFRWLKEKCVELHRPAYIFRYEGVVHIREQRVRLAFEEGGFHPLPKPGAPSTAWGKTSPPVKVLGRLQAGTRLPIRRLVEVYPGLGPRILTLVQIGPESNDLADLGEAGYGFPDQRREPYSAAIVDCNAPKTWVDQGSDPSKGPFQK